MPSVRQPSSAPRDRAERQVFEVLPDLAALERRALALIDLCDVPVADAARDLGLDEDATREAVFAGRRALRRTRAVLTAGARCERAERLHSARLDAPLARADRKWLEIHVARCPRCAEHGELLDQARTELRVAFAAPAEKQLPPAPPAPPKLEAGRAQLRIVPPEPAEPVPEPPAEPEATALAPAVEPRAPAAPAPAPKPAAPTPTRAVTRPGRAAARPSPAVRRAAKVLAILLAIVALLAGAGYGLSQLGDSGQQRAPWAQPHAPDVHPAPLSGQ